MRPSDAQSVRTAASTDAAAYATGTETENPPPFALAPIASVMLNVVFNPIAGFLANSSELHMTLAPPQLTMTGRVHPSKIPFASVGDVAIHPGASRTSFIDATVFDGTSWRALDLSGFGFRKGDRNFDHSDGVGPLMRRIGQTIAARRGAVIYYEIPAGGSRRKYVYRGVSLASILQGNRTFS